MSWANWAILSLAVAISGALAFGVFYLFHSSRESTRLVKTLSLRISLSLGLFAFLGLGWQMGWLHPHGLPLQPVHEHEQE